jgi:tryptophanyl-tRNA synthetase
MAACSSNGVDNGQEHRPPGRTASRIALDLSKLQLPEPSAVTDAARRTEQENKFREVNSQLAKLELADPSVLSTEEMEMEMERCRESLIQAIARLDCGEPEQVIRANLRADGRKTPDKM